MPWKNAYLIKIGKVAKLKAEVRISKVPHRAEFIFIPSLLLQLSASVSSIFYAYVMAFIPQSEIDILLNSASKDDCCIVYGESLLRLNATFRGSIF
jgi:hypothetical protein